MAVIAMAFVPVSLVGLGREPVEAAVSRPNIILITTDDMAATDLRWMPKTRKLLRRAGASVGPFLSNHPMCCPARAEILTGRYAQNNGVHHNTGPWGGHGALRDPRDHIGAWMQAAGYQTAFVGKHLNGWPDNPSDDPGWTIFNPSLEGVYHPFEITMWNDGQPEVHSGTHTSDLMGRFTKRYIRQFATEDAPFFIWNSQLAPHAMQVGGQWRPAVPARRHRTVYANARPPSLSSPSYGERNVQDKPTYVQESLTWHPRQVKRSHRARIRSLKSVDDQIGGMVKTLREQGLLRETYIFFTSDNGFVLGEHRLKGKNFPYEEVIRVPLLVRGPGVAAGSAAHGMYGLVDLAPTFLDIAAADANPTPALDGRSMMPTLTRGRPGYDRYLIQAGDTDKQWWWRGVRSKNFTYVRYDDGFEELYDLRHDPHQLANRAARPQYAAILEEHRARLEQLEGCSGPDCWQGDAPQG